MTDLTKITTPFGLLDAETQEAMRAHGGPYQRWDGYDWIDCGLQEEWRATAYRVKPQPPKPQPPKPREFWIVSHVGAYLLYASRITAQASVADHGGELIHVREVL